MWLPKKLKIVNFISHKSTEFFFKEGATTMIQGINLEDDCQESNGSGKSALIEGTIFAITGDSFRKVRIVELIMNNEPEAFSEIEFFNTVLNQRLLIQRNIKRRGGSEVKVFLNGEEQVKSSVNEYNKYILELFDISKDDLMNYFVVSKEKYQSFLLATDTKKKEIISRFSNSNLIDGVDKLIENDIQVFVQEIQKRTNHINRFTGQIEVYTENLNNQQTKSVFEDNKKSQISSLEADKLILKNSITDIDNSIKKNKKSLEEAKKAFNEISVEQLKLKLEKAENDEEKLIELGNEIKSNVSEYELLISEINKNLAGSVECPKCSHEFVVTNPDFNVKEAKDSINLLEVELEAFKLDLTKARNDYKSAEQIKNNIKSEIRKVENQKHELNMSIKSLESEIKNLDNRVLNVQKNISSIENQIEGVKSIEYKSNSDEIKFKLKELNKNIETSNSEIDELEAEKTKLTEWIYNFKKFKTHLTNKSIRSIEAFTNLYLTKIKTNLNVKMDGYKILSDGKTIRENITVDILRNGLIEGPIEKFSGGEKVRIDICNILALQKLINLNSSSGGIDLLLLDEIIESVDSTGVNEILKQLNSINQTISIITHANNVRDYENVVVVVKQNGYSKIAT